MSSGRVFQSLGPAKANYRSPTVTSLDRGMTSSEEVDDRETASWSDVRNAMYQIRQIPRCSAVNTSVDNDCQFTIDAFRCTQPVKTGKSVSDVV